MEIGDFSKGEIISKIGYYKNRLDFFLIEQQEIDKKIEVCRNMLWNFDKYLRTLE